jgi:1-aminocyclopropane-1-carboxylate deaminase
MLFETSNIGVDQIKDKLLDEKKISLSIVRLDKIHPVISGNKLFKLHYFLEACIHSAHKTILSFGGAYSNHLVATAYSCKKHGLKSVGIVRGEQPLRLSHTLKQCIEYGMQLKFISRDDYATKDEEDFIKKLPDEFGKFLLIPEGGFHPAGARGASLIMQLLDKTYTHICCATGTATTIAGLLLSIEKHQQVIGINVLKGMNDIDERISFLTENKVPMEQLTTLNDYHFGGYAKYTPGLISFMNRIYQQYQLPLDFVYTAKMLYGVLDAAKKGMFPEGSKIACLHTGGLQGNLSLPLNTLTF